MKELSKTYEELYTIFDGVCNSITAFRPYCKQIRNKATRIGTISQSELYNIMGTTGRMISGLLALLEKVEKYPVNAEAVHEGDWDGDGWWDIVTRANETDEEYEARLKSRFDAYNEYAKQETEKRKHETFKNRFKTDPNVKKYNTLRHMLGLAKHDNITSLIESIQPEIDELEKLDIIKTYITRPNKQNIL